MKTKSRTFLFRLGTFLLVLTSCTVAQAWTFAADTELAKNYFSLDLSFQGQVDSIEPTALKSWDFLIGISSLKIQQTSGTSTERSLDLMGAMTWELSERWDLDAGLRLGNAPEQQLTSLGLDAGVVYRTQKASEDKFVPWWELGAQLSTLNYVQRTGGRTYFGASTNTNENQLGQRSLGLSVRQQLLEWFSWKLSLNVYSYSRELNDFLVYLNSNYFLARANQGLRNTIYGLPVTDAQFKLRFYPDKSWDIDFVLGSMKSAVDQSLTTSSKIFFMYHLSEIFDFGAGIKSSRSDSGIDNSLLVSFAIY